MLVKFLTNQSIGDIFTYNAIDKIKTYQIAQNNKQNVHKSLGTGTFDYCF
jgi:hypothetical protein